MNDLDTFVEAWTAAEKRHTDKLASKGDRVPGSYAVSFRHNSRVKTFYRTADSQERAVREAQDGFQWTYGFWPGDPLSVTIES